MTTLRADHGETRAVSAHSAIKLRVPRAAGVQRLATDGCSISSTRRDPRESWSSTVPPARARRASSPTGRGNRRESGLVVHARRARPRRPAECSTNLFAAIDRLRPGSLDGLTSMLGDNVRSDVLADEIIMALDRASGDPAALVLDDFHVIADQPELIGMFRHLVRHLPRGLQLVVVSRSLPALSLDRARLEGRLATVDFDDLRFDSTEAAELLGCLAPDADEAWVERDDRSRRWVGRGAPAVRARRPGPTEAMQITADYLLRRSIPRRAGRTGRVPPRDRRRRSGQRPDRPEPQRTRRCRRAPAPGVRA